MGNSTWIKNLEDLCLGEKGAIVMGPFGSRIKAENYTESGVPMIRGNNLSSPPFHDDDYVFVSDELAADLTSHMAIPGDLLLAHRGTLGQIGMVPYNARYQQYITGNSLVRVRLDPEKADPRYVYYFLISPAGQQEWLANKVQTGVPAISTPTATTRKLPIPTPPIHVQRAIGNFLGTLDDRIALNHAMNQTLEDLARAIFKSWFIDFDPVHAKAEGRSTELPPEIDAFFPSAFVEAEEGRVPEGWQIGDVTDVAQFVNGKNFTKGATGTGRLVIRIADLRAGGETGSTVYNDTEAEPDNIAEQGDILFPWSGSLDLYRWPGDQALINQHIFKVKPTNAPPWYVWGALDQVMPIFQEIASDKATTMGHINRAHLHEGRIVLPPIALLKAASTLLEPLYDRWLVNVRQSRTLTEIRDELLPRLVTGELQIPVEVSA